MKANPHRRGLLGLLAAAPVAAALEPGDSGAGLVRRLRAGFVPTGGRRLLWRFTDEVDRIAPVPREMSPELARLAGRLDVRGQGAMARADAEARAIAALATAFPAKIAAYRSFGTAMRRRLYADLLARESERIAAASEPPPTPPASPGPDA